METTLKQSTERLVRYTLGFLLFVLALNAFGGGYYGMAGAKDVPVEWLQGSPFKDYFIPGLFLFVVIGGTAFFAAVAVFMRRSGGVKMAVASGIITLLWIIVQVAIIGYVSWMQPATTAAALVILLLAWRLSRFEH